MTDSPGPLRSWLAGLLGAASVRAAHATWRVRVIDPQGLAGAVRAGRASAIVAFWHRHILSMLAQFRGMPICVPVSQHQDGEYVAQVMRRFGLRAVRGSTTRGGLKALRGMLGAAREGLTLAVTPDGPRGPVFSVQPGVFLLARRTALPVYPLGIAVDRAWTAASWDRFVIPKPWARVRIAIDKPLDAEQFADAPDFCRALRKALFAAAEQARDALSCTA
jgi:lysophospholipid acyltransferase (LPLAT)-like uncharacterized protein